MTSREHRRRSKRPVTTKQAFEENENEEKLDKSESSLITIPLAPKKHIEKDQLYEKAFFTINDVTVEVILNNNILSWSTVLDEKSVEEIHERKKDDGSSVDLHKVYAISPIYTRSSDLLYNNESTTTMTVSNISTTEKQLRGFKLHSYEKMNDNILQEILIIFQSILSDQIERWYQLLSKLISEYKPIRNILVICNPFAGSRSSRHIYNIKIRPLLERARYNITYLEINDLCSADEVLNDFNGDFDSVYGLVIIGGDGSVINVINALLRYLAKANRDRLTAENDLPPFPFPIAIVPIGVTNIICHSIYGNTDHCTPIIHLLFNQYMKIDISAIFDVNSKFVTANFSAGAGYPANVLKYFRRYSFLSSRKIIQKSFSKATSNKNLKPIEMEIRYIPADQNTVSSSRCYQGCPCCTPATIEQMDNQVKAFDDAHLQKINKRKKTLSSNNDHSSSKTNFNQQNETEKPWKILHDQYLQVAVLTNANLWSFAPQGLSKFGHLADGLLDLVLIRSTTRKDFLRYLKRNGNSKNQYEFAFTSLIKVKEIEIELKLSNDDLNNGLTNTDNQLDSSLSDDLSNEEYLNDENKLKHEPPISKDNRRHHQHLNEQTEELSKNVNLSVPFKSKKDKIPLPRPTSACDNEHIDTKKYRKKSFLNLLMGGKSSSSEKQDSTTTTKNNSSERRASTISRSSSMENVETSTSMKYSNKNQPCLWNLDFTPYNLSLIRMKCFHRFLPVFGVGLSPDTVISEVNYSCFGRIG